MEAPQKKEATSTDAMLPAHQRRTGRIDSLYEFQQRAALYNGVQDDEIDGDKISISALLRDECNVSDAYIGIAPDRRGSDGSDFIESFRKYGVRRSLSSASLFGGERSRALNKCSYYRRQFKAVGFLVLLGVIGGPMNFGIRM